MLRERILTALVLAPLFTLAVLLLPTYWVGLLLALVLLLGAEEWSCLTGLSTRGVYLGFLMACVLGIFGLSWAFMDQAPVLPLLGIASLWWLVVAWRIRKIRAISPLQEGANPAAAGAGLLILLSAWGGLIWLHRQPHGPWLLLFLLMLIWIADIGAYFAGRRWGRVKLAPLVSPGKTLEGVYGALVGATLWGGVLAGLYGVEIMDRIGLVLLCLLTVGASIVGDLYESLLKRRRGVKDSGALLPGHGGVLDRIDSLTAAAPLFALGIALLGGGS